jgi:hypothetical protein
MIPAIVPSADAEISVVLKVIFMPIVDHKMHEKLVGKHHGTMPGKLLPSMCQSSDIQEHPAFHCTYYRMLR